MDLKIERSPAIARKVLQMRRNAIPLLIYAVSLTVLDVSPTASIALALLGSGISFSHLVKMLLGGRTRES